jgi:regulator of PEP synthase PpsR (kinase-PPPase family)
MKYTLAHDDGIASEDLDGADVIVVGRLAGDQDADLHVPRLARHQGGQRAAGAGAPPPMGLLRAKGPLIVGLTVDPTRLAMVRRPLSALG